MAKPTTSPTLSADSLVTGLTHAWLMHEASGTTLHDLAASGAVNGTLTTGTNNVNWGTNDGGDPDLVFGSNSVANALASLASSIDLSGTASVFFRCKQAAANNAGMVLGDTTTTNTYFWLNSGNTLTAFGRGFTVATPDSWHDYLITIDGNSPFDLTCYQDGVQVGSPIATLNSSSFPMNAIGAGYSGQFGFVGHIDCLYLWNRVLSSTDATNLHASPYRIATSGSSISATISETHLPSNHAGNITVHLVGTGTSWSSSTTWTASNVSGWSVASKTFVDSTHYTVVLTGPTAATPPAGATGTLILTEGVTGSVAATTTVATPTLAISPNAGTIGTTPTVTLTGTNTLWATETASGLFAESGGTGASIGTPAVGSDTSATAALTTGSAAVTETITDASTGATATFDVTLPTYDLTDTANVGDVFVRIEGGMTLGTYNGVTAWNSGSGPWPLGAVRFKATTPEIDAYVYCDGGFVRLNIDGVDQGSSVTLPSTASWAWVTIATGLDGSAEHTYGLVSGSAGFGVQKLRTPAGTISTAPLQARPLLAGYGDSIVAGDNPENGSDATNSWVHKAAVSMNYQAADRGMHSQEVSGIGQGSTALITGLSPSPSAVVIQFGTNDVVDYGPLGTNSGTADATFAAAYSDMVRKIQAGLPGAVIACQLLMKAGVGDTHRDGFNTQITSVVSGLANPKIIARSDMRDNYDGSTGVHPDASQCTTLAAAVVNGLGSAIGGGVAAVVRSSQRRRAR